MIPSSPCSPSFRRGTLISQLDFEDFLKMDKNSEQYVSSEWAHFTSEEIRRNTSNSQLRRTTLQVVPDLDELYTPKETASGLEMQRDFRDLHLSWPKITVNIASEPNSFNGGLSDKQDDKVPRSPFLPKTSISEIDNLGILSPLFSVTNTSPVIKTPTTLYEICCSSRKSSDDLSIYLPDNFTPASLESLDKSVNRTVFQFPVSIPKHDHTNDDVFAKGKEEKAPSIAKIPDSRELNGIADDASEQPSIEQGDTKLIDIALVKEKRAEKKRKHHELRQQREKRQKSLLESESIEIKNEITEKTAENSPILRNKLERERRSDLNYRFQKLRESIPDLAEKHKAPKIAILRAATVYANELEKEEIRLEASLKKEKVRNKRLLKSLVNISSNISDQK